MNRTTKRTILGMFSGVIGGLASVTWQSWKALFNDGVYWKLTEGDHNDLRRKLGGGFYVILTAGHPSLSGLGIKLASWMTGKGWPIFTHVLLNVDNEDDPLRSHEFKLVESIQQGVVYSSFMKVFDCDVVALLRPKGFTTDEWEKALIRAKANVGKEYDTLFDLIDNTEMSCVELVRDSLIGSFDNYEEYKSRFLHFETMIEQNNGELIPEMFFKCRDFIIDLYIDRRDD